MENSKFLLEITKIFLLTILIVLVSIINFNIGQKLDKLIKLNTSEVIHIAPDEIL